MAIIFTQQHQWPWIRTRPESALRSTLLPSLIRSEYSSLSVHQVVLRVKLVQNIIRDLPWPANLYLHGVVPRLNLAPITFLVPFWQSLTVHHDGGTELVSLTFN